LKSIDDAEYFLAYVLLTKLSLHFILFAITYTSSQWGLWWTEGSCSGEASLPGLPIKRETC